MQSLSKKLLSAPLQPLPEKVLQFGTGALLRGLPDYLIDKANRAGVFNGRVVVVKSTDTGDASVFAQQDNLYTILTRGIEHGQTVSENTISTAISRVLSAQQQWSEVLAFAASPALEIVLSNTTEVGIQLVDEDIRQMPPKSFPGKLLAFLHARYRAFYSDPSKGLTIVPTELLTDNGRLLESIVLELAHKNNLEFGFIEWLENACIFCNSLVDRIVPGQPSEESLDAIQQELGYTDGLITVTEPYCLWAIEGDEKVAKTLSFQTVSPESVIVAADINGYRERKLRLLNGTHTLSCGLAYLAGFHTVHAAMEDAEMSAFIERLVIQEIAPAIPYPLPEGDAVQFGQQVLERFRNPFVEHRWLSITVQYAAKMRMRNLPVLLEHYQKNQTPPRCFALGFAAFLCFYRQIKDPIKDEHAAYFIEKWQHQSPEVLVEGVLKDQKFWGADLSLLPGFGPLVLAFVQDMLAKGAHQVLHELLQQDEITHFTNTSV